MFSFGPISIFVVFAAAETPPGFTLNVTAHLDVILPFGSDYSRTSDEQSEFVYTCERRSVGSDTLTGVASLPTIGTSDEVLSGTYLYIMIGQYHRHVFQYLLTRSRRS
jgi:phosphatidylethanolamine-binding protein